MTLLEPLPDLLHPTREVDGDEVSYGFANGLSIQTEIFNKNDRLRILPLGSPQFSVMNHLLAFPDAVAGKRVFEPFAGSGALGLMALKAGAEHVDFLDVNPRACEFQRRNAEQSGLLESRIDSICGDVAEYIPAQHYDLVLANPPFVPTPDGIEGTITSNGGSEGNRFVEILIERLEAFLTPSGRALVYVFQFEQQGRPLVVDLLETTLDHRPVELSLAQEQPIPFETYCTAYRQLFKERVDAIERWRSALMGRYGDGMTVSHYVIDIGPRGVVPTRCEIRSNFAEKYGASFCAPSGNVDELAFGRVFENFTVEPTTARDEGTA